MANFQRYGRPLPLLPLLLAMALLAGVDVTTSSAFDLTAHWRESSGLLDVITQSGVDVTVERPGFVSGSTSQSGDTYHATVSGSSITAADPYASLTLSADESTLSGSLDAYGCTLGFCQTYRISVSMSRCECFDGNADNGDGCDVECRVEPCFGCSAEPSVCTPLADGVACESRNQCSVGTGTCDAGVCESSAVEGSCFDMSGRWLRINNGTPVIQNVIQRDGTLTFLGYPGGLVEETGTIDVSTAEIETSGTDHWPSCGNTGLIEPAHIEGAGYRGIAWYSYAATPGACVGSDGPLIEVGLRCAGDGLPAEDGCSVDSCMQCSGAPAVCEPVPDSTPCRFADSITSLATCQRGECIASISRTESGCHALPRTNCHSTDDPSSSALSIVENATADSLKWSWKDGGPILAYDLGRPESASDVALCIFDESTSTPSLLYEAIIPTQYNYYPWEYTVSPNWKVRDDGSARYKDTVSSMQLRAGDDGQLKLKRKGSLANFPSEMPLPLRAQLQIEGGACFESVFTTAGVRRNADGKFQAKGSE